MVPSLRKTSSIQCGLPSGTQGLPGFLLSACPYPLGLCPGRATLGRMRGQGSALLTAAHSQSQVCVPGTSLMCPEGLMVPNSEACSPAPISVPHSPHSLQVTSPSLPFP